MKILRNYLLNEFLGPFFLSLAILTFVMMLGNLVKLADLIITKGVSLFSVLKLFIYLIPTLLTYTTPLAVMFGLLLSLGRLSSDNEIIAIRSSGINLLNLLMPLIAVGIILSLLLVIINDRVVPRTHFTSRKTLVDIGVKNPASCLEAGTFINSFQSYILFIYRIDGNKLTNVRIYEPQKEGKATRTIVAKKGEFISFPDKKIIKLKLMDGTSDEPDPKNPKSFYKLNFKTYFMTLNLAQGLQDTQLEKKAKDMEIKELGKEINKLASEKIDAAPLLTEIHKRIAMASSCLVFILLGFPLALITHRRQVSINFGMAFGVVVIYYLFLLGTEALSLQGNLNPAVAMWLPNVVLSLIGIILTIKLCVS